MELFLFILGTVVGGLVYNRYMVQIDDLIQKIKNIL